METIEEEALEGISEDEKSQLFSLLRRVKENLNKAIKKGEISK